MRSKSLDRNSFNSGDAFNAVDWTGERNAFGTGLPPAWDNQDSWPQMRTVLERAEDLRPRAEDAAFVKRWTQALLRLRRDEPLLRLTTSDAVQAALRFVPVDGEPGLVIGHLDGRALPATHLAHGRELLYVLNTDPRPRTTTAVAGDGWTPHRALEGLAEGALGDDGQVSVPGRSVAVFVR